MTGSETTTISEREYRVRLRRVRERMPEQGVADGGNGRRALR